jgi:hypothetical protein
MVSEAADTDASWASAIVRSVQSYSFVRFHREQLPVLVEQRGHLVAADLAGVPPLAFRSDGMAFTWVPSERGVQVREGREGEADAATVVELSGETFSAFLHELLTVRGAVNTGRAQIVRGELAGWQRWEPAIRSLCSGREIYGPAVWRTLVDRTGAPLDLHRAFSIDDDPDEMRHFFRLAGYLHLKAVFTRDEVERYGAEVEFARQRTTPEDPSSWWSVTADGVDVVTRINYLDRYSSLLTELADGPRLDRCARLAGPGLRVCVDRLDGPMVFIKNSNVVKGNGDLIWHIDPALGGTPVICPFIQIGIQLDHANPANGQLLVLAGSHRYTKHDVSWGDEADLPVVAIETEPGDVTIHDANALHTTPPPTGDDAGRRVLYYKFAEQKTFDWIPAGCHYNDGLFQSGSQYQAVTDAYSTG